MFSTRRLLETWRTLRCPSLRPLVEGTEEPLCWIHPTVKHTAGTYGFFCCVEEDFVALGLSLTQLSPSYPTIVSLHLPEDFPKLSGAKHVPKNVTISTSNDIREQFEGKNVTASDTVHMLDFLIKRVYHSTPDVANTPYACEFSGLAQLECPSTNTSKPSLLDDDEPLRAVTLAGLLVPAPWATGGKTLTLKEAEGFYDMMDFIEMKHIGLNAVQLPVPTIAFDSSSKQGAEIMTLLKSLLQDIHIAGLVTIVNLVSTADELDDIVAAGAFCDKTEGVLAMTLPSDTMLDPKVVVKSIRVQAPKFPIFIPVNQGQLTTMDGDFDDHVYGALGLTHMDSVGDVASSSSVEDRSKLFYHEATSCITRSPMEYSECFRNFPLFLSFGFDLSIDDCIFQGEESFKDYGQCDRFDETVHSDFWHRHRASYAARQLYAYEQGLGWSFATWKLYDNDKVGTLDDPAKLMALQDVVKAGLFPDLHDTIPAQEACLNPPEADFELGDDTLSPTLAPPPDCGNGWWNYTSKKCDYWIPPTPAPIEPCPTCAPCEEPATSTSDTNATLPIAIGVLAGLVVGGILGRLCGNKRHDYSAIPN
eukprot:scaffold7641_cov115-Cylindrotheca_fusiformis.AAC.11